MEALLLPILLIAVFYFLLIRPQQRQRRQMTDMQSSLGVGSKVMTGGGLIGTVVSIDDDEVLLEVAPGVTNRYVRRAIVNVLDSPDANDLLKDADPSAIGDEADTTATEGETASEAGDAPEPEKGEEGAAGNGDRDQSDGPESR